MMARCPFRRMSAMSDAAVREQTDDLAASLHTGNPVNREYPNRNGARRDRLPHSAEQELLDRQQHQLCVSATSSLALSIWAPLISAACCQSCDGPCRALCSGLMQSMRTRQLSWPWPRRE